MQRPMYASLPGSLKTEGQVKTFHKKQRELKTHEKKQIRQPGIASIK